MDHKEDESETDGDTADDDVGDPEEWIFAAQPRGGRQDHLLPAVEIYHRVS